MKKKIAIATILSSIGLDAYSFDFDSTSTNVKYNEDESSISRTDFIKHGSGYHSYVYGDVGRNIDIGLLGGYGKTNRFTRLPYGHSITGGPSVIYDVDESRFHPALSLRSELRLSHDGYKDYISYSIKFSSYTSSSSNFDHELIFRFGNLISYSQSLKAGVTYDGSIVGLLIGVDTR